MYASLVPIIAGVSLASLKELSFSWMSFIAGTGSAVTSAAKAILSKKVLDGKPLGDAIVLFTSAAGMSSFGKTDTTGRYRVAYRSNLEGAAIGPSVVRITTNQTELPGAGYRDPIPAKYNSASTLKAEVKPGGNTIDFPLSSK